jgi:4,5-dihydroxyphthalate decarboxylase
VARLPLTLACWDYDRTRALADGRVRPDGIDLTCLDLPVEETFFRMLRHHEFAVAEMSLSSYLMSCFAPEPPFIAIPVFPSRYFRHSCIYLHAASGIREPRDLAGRRVGTPEYQMTAPVWIRGMLADEYGVPVESVTYVCGGLEEPNRPDTRRELGQDFWPYGLAANRGTLATFLRYSHAQGLSHAGPLATAADPGGAVRAGNAGVVPHLTA